MEYLVAIKADTNDADYISKTTKLTEEQFAGKKELIEKVAAAIKNVPGHNWNTLEWADTTVNEQYEDVLTEDEIEAFEEFTPHGENGIHTIYDIIIYDVSNTTILL